VDGFDLFEGDGVAVAVELQEPAEGLELLGLVVDQVGELLVLPVVTGADRLLERADGLGVPLVVDAVRAVLVLALAFEVGVGAEGDAVAGQEVSVPSKYSSTSPELSPTASNIWAPW
jgi:hypothetical protein